MLGSGTTIPERITSYPLYSLDSLSMLLHGKKVAVAATDVDRPMHDLRPNYCPGSLSCPWAVPSFSFSCCEERASLVIYISLYEQRMYCGFTGPLILQLSLHSHCLGSAMVLPRVNLHDTSLLVSILYMMGFDRMLSRQYNMPPNWICSPGTRCHTAFPMHQDLSVN